MKLVKVNRPFYAHNGLDRLMNEFLNEGCSYDRYAKNELTYNPSTNVFETDNSFALEISIPGYEKEQVSLSVENDLLTVKAEVKETEEKDYKYSRREFAVSDFEKSFKLSKNINQEKIEAAFKNGVLVVTLPKKEEAISIKRQIDVV